MWPPVNFTHEMNNRLAHYVVPATEKNRQQRRSSRLSDWYRYIHSWASGGRSQESQGNTAG
jgi:hypothetical protein